MSNTAHRAEIEKQAQVTIYMSGKPVQTVLKWKGNPENAIFKMSLMIGLAINHWHFN